MLISLSFHAVRFIVSVHVDVLVVYYRFAPTLFMLSDIL
jgi:hypothetical protein